jgi:protein-disulfide reductase (glutathione)
MAVMILFLLAAVGAFAEQDLSNGMGSSINWVAWGDAKAVAAEQNKPIMLVIHKSWCGACKQLKPKFAASTDIAELSNNFVMVNTLDDDEPAEAAFKPDGGYIPRVLFLNPAGEVLTEVQNKQGNPKYGQF